MVAFSLGDCNGVKQRDWRPGRPAWALVWQVWPVLGLQEQGQAVHQKSVRQD